MKTYANNLTNLKSNNRILKRISKNLRSQMNAQVRRIHRLNRRKIRVRLDDDVIQISIDFKINLANHTARRGQNSHPIDQVPNTCRIIVD